MNLIIQKPSKDLRCFANAKNTDKNLSEIQEWKNTIKSINPYYIDIISGKERNSRSHVTTKIE